MFLGKVCVRVHHESTSLQMMYSVMFLNMMLAKSCSCLFISLQILRKYSKMLFCCAPHFFMHPSLFYSPGFSFQVHFIIQACYSVKFCFKQVRQRFGWFEFNNFGRQKYKVVNLQRKDMMVEMIKKQLGKSAVGYDSMILLLAFIFYLV